MDPSLFDYILPKELIAQVPIHPRDSSKLLLINRHDQSLTHHHFSDLPKLLQPNDVLVFNSTKVFPARLLGFKPTGGKAELLLLQSENPDTWRAIGRPCLKLDQVINFDRQLSAKVISLLDDGQLLVQFNQSGANLMSLIDQIGHTPLPPYIHSHSSEAKLCRQYQTVYAKKIGSAAAPTAGLHFTSTLLEQLKTSGHKLEFVTLHIGLGTFKPVNPEQIKSGKLHTEPYTIDPDTLKRLLQAKQAGSRLIAVGTTTARVLESYANTQELSGDTDIFIKPPYQFKLVDGLITNFHLPQSSLLMMVSAFASYPNTTAKFTDLNHSLIGKAYEEAVKNQYRFFSFGDATLIL